MSRRQKRKHTVETPKPDPLVHPVPTPKGRRYKFTDKHHHCAKSDHACWLKTIGRDTEFSLFQHAETGDYSDDSENLYNVHKDGEEYIEIGTRHELLAIFWNPHSASLEVTPRRPTEFRFLSGETLLAVSDRAYIFCV